MTESSGYTLFDSAVGRCAIAWRDRGGDVRVTATQLPGADEAATRARICRLRPDAVEASPPADVAAVIASIAALLAGEPRDLSAVPLDMDDIPAFDRRVYDLARAIHPGEVRCYGDLAAGLGVPGASRAVGQALGRNPFPIVVPCHRVVAAGGRPGGFSAPGGSATKLRLLEIEAAGGLARRLPGL